MKLGFDYLMVIIRQAGIYSELYKKRSIAVLISVKFMFECRTHIQFAIHCKNGVHALPSVVILEVHGLHLHTAHPLEARRFRPRNSTKDQWN